MDVNCRCVFILPAACLVYFGLDQNCSIVAHCHKRQNADDCHYDEQDGKTCAHKTRTSHPHVTSLTHEPEVIACKAADAQTKVIYMCNILLDKQKEMLFFEHSYRQTGSWPGWCVQMP